MTKKVKLHIAIISLIISFIVIILTTSKFSPIVFLMISSYFLYITTKYDLSDTLLLFSIGTVAVLFFYHYWNMVYGLPYFQGLQSDDWQFDQYWSNNFIETYGINILKIPEHLNNLESGLGFLHNSKGYVAVVIVLRYFSSFLDGYHTLLPRLFNIFILTLISYYSSLIAFYYTKNEKVKRLALYSIFFFPVMLFNSVHVFRDTIVSFLLVYIFYHLLVRKKTFINYIKLLPLLIVLFFFRTSTFFISILMILLLSFDLKSIIKQGLIIGLIFAALTYFFMYDYLIILISQAERYSTINAERMGNIGSKIFELPLVIGVIPRLMFILFSPVPNFNSFHQLYISFSAILQVLFFPFLFWGIFSKQIDSKLIYTFLLFFIGVALTTATFRHVMMFIPFGIVITILSFYQNVIRFKTYKYILSLFVLTITFFSSIILSMFY